MTSFSYRQLRPCHLIVRITAINRRRTTICLHLLLHTMRPLFRTAHLRHMTRIVVTTGDRSRTCIHSLGSRFAITRVRPTTPASKITTGTVSLDNIDHKTAVGQDQETSTETTGISTVIEATTSMVDVVNTATLSLHLIAHYFGNAMRQARRSCLA